MAGSFEEHPEHLPAPRHTVRTGALYWLAGFLSGLIASALATPAVRRRDALSRWNRQWRQGVRRMLHAKPSPDRSIEPLRNQLVGRTRGEVAAILGPPPASSAQPRPAATAAYWHAESWYYPLNPARRTALAVNFVHDVVRSIDPVAGPDV